MASRYSPSLWIFIKHCALALALALTLTHSPPYAFGVKQQERESAREEGRENVIQRTVLHTTSDFTNTISSKRCKWKFSALAFGIVLYWLATRTRMFHIICNYKKLYSAILLYRTGAAIMRWRHFITSEQPMNMDGYLFSIFFWLILNNTDCPDCI